MPHAARLEHQRARLGDGHEVANDVAVGHRHGASALDLLAEEWYHRAVAAQHVAKAGGDELRVLAHLLGIEEERLAVDLGQALGAAHDVAGVHSLVGRYHDKLITTTTSAMTGAVRCLLPPGNTAPRCAPPPTAQTRQEDVL